METPSDEIRCSEVLGGTGGCDITVALAGGRAACWSAPFAGGATGGDIYFLSVCGKNILSKIVVADVSGHGEQVSAASAIIHDALVAHRNEHDNVGMLRQVNAEFLARHTGELRFTTIAAAIFDRRDHSLVYAYGGHPSILHGDASARRFGPLDAPDGAARGMPLGIMPDARYHEARAQLAPGDVVVLYTDAFSEIRTEKEAMLGDAGLAALLNGAKSWDPAALKAHLVAALGDQLADDATVVVLQLE